MRHLVDVFERFTAGGTVSDRILIFDIDDTLVKTDAEIRVMKGGEVVKRVDTQEYTEYKLQPGESFDFSEFSDMQILQKGVPLKYFKTLKREYDKGTHISILTARSCSINNLHNFFINHGVDIKKELIFAINSPECDYTGTDAEKKAVAVKHIIGLGYKTLIFFDDCQENLDLAEKEAKKDGAKIFTVKA